LRLAATQLRQSTSALALDQGTQTLPHQRRLFRHAGDLLSLAQQFVIDIQSRSHSATSEQKCIVIMHHLMHILMPFQECPFGIITA
jgi:hypothetical protein